MTEDTIPRDKRSKKLTSELTGIIPESHSDLPVHDRIDIHALVQELKENRIREKIMYRRVEELETRNKELKSYAEIVAHDFRTPMVNLKGFSQELSYSFTELKQIIKDSKSHFPKKTQQKVDTLLEEDISDAVHFIQSAINRMDRMVSALLKLSRLGRQEMNYLEVNMNDLVQTIVQSFRHQIEQKGIEVTLESLPLIVTDYLAMEQIISNLLDNAIKYLVPGRSGKIRISCRENEEEVIFSIQDNGRGIAACDHEKVFEIFGKSGVPDVPGDGMGLAYVKALVCQLGGKIWCESELEIGTEIFFTIPKN